MTKVFYSQQGEDFFVYRNFINQHRSDGIFVELGACNGVLYSNTKFFEDFLGFNGVLIEPIVEMYNQCKQNRKAMVYNCAISKEEGVVEMIGNNPVAGIVSTMTPDFKARWHKTSGTRMVNTKPISNVLKTSTIKYIDLMTIDVEGSELGVLESMDWSIPVYIVCIELDDNYNSDKDEKCREILRKNGFTFVNRMCINEFWINRNYERRELLFKEPSTFTGSLYDYGEHPNLAKHCYSEIVKSIEKYEHLSSPYTFRLPEELNL